MEYTAEHATLLDQNDPLAKFRSHFYIPPHGKTAEKLYFTGNSLGLQPKRAKELILEELEDWAQLGVEGHVHAKRPWMPYHENFTASLARLTGAKESEVVAMGTLTNNLHLLMVSFYRPEGKKRKILCESKAFPSDQYALKSQIAFHGGNPKTDLLELQPRPGEFTLRTEDIIDTIKQNKDEIALIMLSGVNYYTGQCFDMEAISKVANQNKTVIGWDLAHAMGNIPLKLNDWGVDFASWCSYKYLNGGPGCVSGVFVHQKHHKKKDLHRFAGWWGHDKSSRFDMPEDFVPIPSAEAWQLSNPPILGMTALLASLELFDQAGMKALREKAVKLNKYLRFVVNEISERSGVSINIITPEEEKAHGCQLSLVFPKNGKALFDILTAQGVIADWREPDVIRMAPVPLYNRFQDIYEFGKKLEFAIEKTMERNA
ncbi:MAG: kynureninase [Cryomorphaceae bacterium]|nr:kynureninase [Cryomorphaceae bacterium]